MLFIKGLTLWALSLGSAVAVAQSGEGADWKWTDVSSLRRAGR